MPKVLVGGQNVWYEVSGDGEPIVLIGGFALLNDQFEFCTQMIVDKGFQVINWTYRGSGKSDYTAVRPYTIDDWVDDLRAILDDAGVDRTNIWATSTSSVIGMRFAAKYPERTRALVTYPWYQATQYWKDLFDAAEAVCRMFSPKALSRIFAGSVLPPAMQYTEEHLSYEKWSGPKYEANIHMPTLRNTLNALSNVDLSGDIPRIKCPVMLLLGNDSALNAMEHKKAASYDKLVNDFLELKPDTDVGTVEGAGSTYCMITRPEDTVKILVGYLAGLNA